MPYLNLNITQEDYWAFQNFKTRRKATTNAEAFRQLLELAKENMANHKFKNTHGKDDR